jgi:hypothetical protein
MFQTDNCIQIETITIFRFYCCENVVLDLFAKAMATMAMELPLQVPDLRS